MKRYFEFKDDKSSKFWEITLDGTNVSTRYGKIGSDGQTTTKFFASEDDAKKEYDALIREKTKKGYREIGANTDDTVLSDLKKKIRVCQEDDEMEKLERLCLEAYRLDPRDVEVLCAIGGLTHYKAVMLEGGEVKSFANTDAIKLAREAFKYYQTAAELDADEAAQCEAFYWLGEISEQLGDYLQAVKYYKIQAEKTDDEYCKKRPIEIMRELGGAPRKTKSDEKAASNYPFPFFGAGDAEYFEWAEVQIRFAHQPSPDQRKKIMKSAPPPIKPEKDDFRGRMLLAGGGQFIHELIEVAYGDESKIPVRSYEAEDGEDFNDEMFFTEHTDTFNADIERWLLEIHQFCPVQYAYRAEDGEAGGTRFSKWHTASVKDAQTLLKTIVREKDVYAQGKDETELFIHSLAGIAHYSKIHLMDLPVRFRNEFFPEYNVAALIKQKKYDQAVDFAFAWAEKNKDYEELFGLLDTFNKDVEFIKATAERGLKDRRFVNPVKRGEKWNFLEALDGLYGKYMYAGRWVDMLEICQLRMKLTDTSLISPDAQTLNFYNNILLPYLYLDKPSKEIDKIIRFASPFAPKLPGIYHNLACLYVKRGELDEALEQIKLAKKHKYPKMDTIRTDIDLKPLSENPEFQALFEKEPTPKAKRAKEKKSALTVSSSPGKTPREYFSKNIIKDITLNLMIIESIFFYTEDMNKELEKISDLLIDEEDLNRFCKRYLGRSYNENSTEPNRDIEEFLLNLKFSDASYRSFTELTIDADYEPFRWILPSWDGKDEYFTVKSLEGIEICANLEELNISGMIDEPVDMRPLAGLKKLRELNFNMHDLKNFSSLLEMQSLEKVIIVNMTANHPEAGNLTGVLERLKKRGVKTEIQ